ncbi:MAG: hypothetical protein AAFO69_14280, partial [Bacteroidota bacterium]
LNKLIDTKTIKMNLKRITFAGSLLIGLFVLTSASSPLSENKVQGDDDLRCVIKNKEGVKLGACWFCDCATLAKRIVP